MSIMFPVIECHLFPLLLSVTSRFSAHTAYKERGTLPSLQCVPIYKHVCISSAGVKAKGGWWVDVRRRSP